GQHPFKLIFAGRLLFWKGMHLGLRAFARLLEKWPNSQLTIVGSGPDKKRLHSLAEHLKVN
ncbi:glycosyltransferase family 4 protein, partial [Candidatus Saccharibacteria bacterium]|nr:glycosyltransferase family 4 protein [Candidatus Saccharibacteria bacterium]NIR52824.1 glycosyltransferase family 4 protein [candidate division KSB1 bacterium]NIU92273.1 glycosyltransferase [candidate division KSB1 bacterium]NIV70077.1 glycosyltransferase [Phycisphaerae bacterium]NIW73302.1 glycosyltransferase [candidate division KSB1 bacterium]